MSSLNYHTLIYFLIGTIIAFFIELAMVSTGEKVGWRERAIMVILWPLVGIIFVWNFIKEFWK